MYERSYIYVKYQMHETSTIGPSDKQQRHQNVYNKSLFGTGLNVPITHIQREALFRKGTNILNDDITK